MKKIILISSVACLSILAIIFIGCSKVAPNNTNSGQQLANTIVAELPSTNGVTVNNGILTFASVEIFKNKMTELNASESAELKQWRTSFAGYQSLADKYLEMDINAENEISASASKACENNQIIDVPDENFASIINNKGEVIIGTKIFKVTSNSSWEVPLSAMATNGVINWTNKIERKVLRNVMMPTIKPFLTDNDGNTWPKSNGKQVRFVHTKWCYAIPYVYGSIGTKIRMERNGTFGWVNINHSSAYFSPYGATYTENYNAIPNISFTVNHPLSSTSVNNNMFQRVIGWAAGTIWSYEFDAGTFRTNAFITYGGKTKNHDWIH